MTDREYQEEMHKGMAELNRLCDKWCHVWCDLIMLKMAEVETEIRTRSEEPPDRVLRLIKTV
jgi:hypothetical protein